MHTTIFHLFNLGFSCRIKVVRNYEKPLCQVELSGVRLSDGGNWSCKTEHYGWGNNRDMDEAMVSLTVIKQEEGDEQPETGWRT